MLHQCSYGGGRGGGAGGGGGGGGSCILMMLLLRTACILICPHYSTADRTHVFAEHDVVEGGRTNEKEDLLDCLVDERLLHAVLAHGGVQDAELLNDGGDGMLLERFLKPDGFMLEIPCKLSCSSKPGTVGRESQAADLRLLIKKGRFQNLHLIMISAEIGNDLDVFGELDDLFLQVLPPLAPPADVFLDGHAGSSESVQAQLLEISYLTGSEEDLCPTKLVLVGVLEIKPQDQSLNTC
ncbi:hypothetical protein EYF80_002823 [Liparis tanakae]|uniref:Uncharacterized protein n=1 Tax=Liparis tanakae TaxID=230148 RepID=A0A4Z2JBQ2_9TELE|nr:hypothetical protein EYF80_002823 [Liparis tanakae]